ncbi:MAG: hypothetical protein M1166_01330 [Candidatus Thermoplasmatota archaeon]|nr:hypothetical protein [Candidatus Thermoplasmatota archaeon]
MNTLMQHEFTKSKASKLAGISRSMLYYNKRPREHRFDPDLEKKIQYLI